MGLNLYGPKLLESLESDILRLHTAQDRRERDIAECLFESSDSFLSELANGISQRVTREKIAVLKNGGVWGFRYLRHDETGELFPVRWVETKYGARCPIRLGDKTIWLSHTTDRAIKKHGLTVVEVDRPAWVCLRGSGRGLSGTCSIHIFESEWNYWTGEPASPATLTTVEV